MKILSTIQDRGIATFSTKFNLKAFPFDSHILEFIYADVKSSISQYLSIMITMPTTP